MLDSVGGSVRREGEPSMRWWLIRGEIRVSFSRGRLQSGSFLLQKRCGGAEVFGGRMRGRRVARSRKFEELRTGEERIAHARRTRKEEERTRLRPEARGTWKEVRSGLGHSKAA